MLFRPTSSSSLVAEVRKFFGLQQQQLADYIGVSRELLANVEAGRRDISSSVLLRLNPLAARMPEHAAPDATDFSDEPITAPHAADLEFRRAECLHKAGQLRWKMRPLARRIRFAKRWQQVLPGLLAAAATEPVADPQAARARRWLLSRQADAADELDALQSAQWHLLRVRAEALEAEAAALAALLPPAAE